MAVVVVVAAVSVRIAVVRHTQNPDFVAVAAIGVEGSDRKCSF